MATINLAEKFSPQLDKRFTLTSVTGGCTSNKYDFEGVRGVKIYSVDKVETQDYNRKASSNRFGTPKELGDTVQSMLLRKDRSFTFTIDRGNAKDQLNIKSCKRVLADNWDEVVIPERDIYILGEWANGAGLGIINSTALTEKTSMRAIFTAAAMLNNKKVPKKNRWVFVRETAYIEWALSEHIMGADKLNASVLTNGVTGKIAGMKVVPVPDDYLPDGIQFVIKWKGASVDPLKMKVLRAHTNPPGLDGDLGECRYFHDSFVLDNKIDGILVYAQSGMCALPTGDVGKTTAGKVTLNCATSGATIMFTRDGTNPKTSDTAEQYTTAFSSETESGTYVVRAYAKKTDNVNSSVFNLKYKV